MKKPKMNKLKTMIVVQALIIGLLITTLAYVYAQSGTTFTISEGVYPGAPDYTIWNEGSTYYAKDAYGAITSGTNESQIINNLIANDRTILLKTGTYTLTATILVKSKENVVIMGEGWDTVLKVADNTAINAITINQSNRIWIRNLKIDGNGFNQADGGSRNNQIGIYLYKTTYAYIEKIEIQWTVYANIRWYYGGHGIIRNCLLNGTIGGSDVAEDAVSLKGDSNIFLRNVIIENNEIRNSGHQSVEISYYSRNVIVRNNRIFDSTKEAIIVHNQGSERVLIDGNYIENASSNGAIVVNVPRVTVVNNIIEDSKYPISFDDDATEGTTPIGFTIANNLIRSTQATPAIRVANSSDGTISGNVIISSEQWGIRIKGSDKLTISNNMIKSSTYDGISIRDDSDYLTIVGNEVNNNGDWGIEIETADCDGNVISSTVARDNTTGGIKDSGTNTKVNLSWNGTTWIS